MQTEILPIDDDEVDSSWIKLGYGEYHTVMLKTASGTIPADVEMHLQTQDIDGGATTQIVLAEDGPHGTWVVVHGPAIYRLHRPAGGSVGVGADRG